MTPAKSSILVLILFISTLLFTISLFASTSASLPQAQSTKKLPLDQPNMNTEDVIAWATEAIETTSTLNFDDYQSRLENAKKYFTASAWSMYMRTLDLAGSLKALIALKQKVITKVITTGAFKPKIIAESVSGGAYMWKLEVPVLITYQSAPYTESDTLVSPQIVDITIQRQPLQQGYKGLAIVEMWNRLPGPS